MSLYSFPTTGWTPFTGGWGWANSHPQPIVGYLARTLSAFYGLFGGLLWVLSFDPDRYHVIIRYIGAAMLAFGIALVVIDWSEGMPYYWRVLEGPIAILYGGLILKLNQATAQPLRSDTTE